MAKDSEKELYFEETDPIESIASTIIAALYNEESKVLTLIFSDITNKQAIRKFVMSAVTCSIMNPDGKKKKSQPLKAIAQKVSGNKLPLKFNLDITMDDFITSNGTSKSDIATSDTVAFSTMNAGCIRVLPITKNFLECHKK